MPRIKVLHYLNNIDIGGTVKTALLFTKHLDRGNFIPFFATSDRVNKKDLGVPERIKGFIDAVGDDRSFFIPYGDKQRFQQLIDVIKPDILHLYRAGSPEFPQPGVDFDPKGCKIVETNVFGLIDFNPHIHKTLFMSKWLMDFALGTLYEKYPNTDGKPRFDFVNNPVETPYCRYKYELDLKPSKRDNTISLGRVGRSDNGIYDSIAVKAIKSLIDKGYHNLCVMSVATPPAMLQEMKDLDIPHLALEPTGDELFLSTVYSSMDIYCHARADGETFGVNIAEAMMHGVPVITHVATPKIPNMSVFQAQTTLVDHGKTGYIVDPYSVEQYAHYLELLICNEKMRRDMGYEGEKKAVEQYFFYPVIRKLEKIYQEIL